MGGGHEDLQGMRWGITAELSIACVELWLRMDSEAVMIDEQVTPCSSLLHSLPFSVRVSYLISTDSHVLHQAACSDRKTDGTRGIARCKCDVYVCPVAAEMDAGGWASDSHVVLLWSPCGSPSSRFSSVSLPHSLSPHHPPPHSKRTQHFPPHHSNAVVNTSAFSPLQPPPLHCRCNDTPLFIFQTLVSYLSLSALSSAHCRLP